MESLSLSIKILQKFYNRVFFAVNDQTLTGFMSLSFSQKSCNPVDTGRKLNVHKTFRRRPGRLLNILYTFNLRPVSTGNMDFWQSPKYVSQRSGPSSFHVHTTSNNFFMKSFKRFKSCINKSKYFTIDPQVNIFPHQSWTTHHYRFFLLNGKYTMPNGKWKMEPNTFILSIWSSLLCFLIGFWCNADTP